MTPFGPWAVIYQTLTSFMSRFDTLALRLTIILQGVCLRVTIERNSIYHLGFCSQSQWLQAFPSCYSCDICTAASSLMQNHLTTCQAVLGSAEGPFNVIQSFLCKRCLLCWDWSKFIIYYRCAALCCPSLAFWIKIRVVIGKSLQNKYFITRRVCFHPPCNAQSSFIVLRLLILRKSEKHKFGSDIFFGENSLTTCTIFPKVICLPLGSRFYNLSSLQIVHFI